MTAWSESRRRRAEIVAAATAATSPKELARRFGISTRQVYNVLWQARRAGIDVPKYRSGSEAGGTRILLSASTVTKLAAEATRRGIEPRDLAEQLLCACIDSNIVAAVLDDEGYCDV